MRTVTGDIVPHFPNAGKVPMKIHPQTRVFSWAHIVLICLCSAGLPSEGPGRFLPLGFFLTMEQSVGRERPSVCTAAEDTEGSSGGWRCSSGCDHHEMIWETAPTLGFRVQLLFWITHMRELTYENLGYLFFYF